MDQIFYPMVDGLGAGIALLAAFSIYLALLLKKQGRQLREEVKKIAAVDEQIAEIRTQLGMVASRIEDLEKRRALNAAGSDTPFHLNSRGQVLRLHRNGESVQSIAAALGLSQGEVKLTVGVHELSSELPDGEN